MTAERRAILLLLSLAVAGQGIRYLLTRPDSAPGDIQILGSAPGRSPSQQAEAAREANRPLEDGEKIDADRATVQELARLPRIGPALAQRIVSDRDSNGPFGSLEGFDRVPGVGPGLLRVVAPHLTFSNPARAIVSGRTTHPSSGTSLAAPVSPPTTLNLNRASPAEIERLPLIGPSRALAIVAWRERHGSFKTLDDLIAIPGVSRQMAEAIRHLVAF